MKKSTVLLIAAIIVLAAGLTIHAQSAPRIFMLVTASVEPGHMADYQGIVEKEVFPIFEKQNVEVIGAFSSALGGASNETVVLVAFKDFAHLQQALADPGITKLQAEKFESMRVLHTRILNPTSFSPLK